MSNFENEYKKYSKESTPDLWARIEAGVDAYEKASESAADNKVVSITDIPNKKRSNKGMYISLIAVAACILIAVPAIIFTGKDTNGRLDAAKSSNMAAADVAEAPAAEAPMMEAAEAPAAEEPMMEAAPMMAEDVCEEAACEEAADYSDNELADEPVTFAESADAFAGASIAPNSKQSEFEAQKEMYPIRAMWDSKGTVRFFFDEPVKNFKILNIEITDITENGKLVYNSEVAYEGGSYKGGDEMTFEMNFPGDLPSYAVSYTDSDGNEHTLLVSESGYDGSIVLSEM